MNDFLIINCMKQRAQFCLSVQLAPLSLPHEVPFSLHIQGDKAGTPLMGQRGLNIFTSEVPRGQQVNQNYEPTSMQVPLILSIRRTTPHFLMGKQAIE